MTALQRFQSYLAAVESRLRWKTIATGAAILAAEVLALLPFEPEAHARLGGPACTYVGHPLIERLAALRPNADFARPKSERQPEGDQNATVVGAPVPPRVASPSWPKVLSPQQRTV